MKVGNVILAIFLWLCIPGGIVLGIIGAIPYGISGRSSDSMFTCVCGPTILVFIIGLVILIRGMEKNGTYVPIQHQTQIPDRRCPNCGRIIPNDARFCPYCLKKFW